MLFPRKKNTDLIETPPEPGLPNPQAFSVIGPGLCYQGSIHGRGNLRIEGVFNGEIHLQGVVIVAETGKVLCPEINAETVVVAGLVQGNIRCQKLDVRASGRIWGDVISVSFSSAEGAFLRGQMRMEDKIEISIAPPSQLSDESQLFSSNWPNEAEASKDPLLTPDWDLDSDEYAPPILRLESQTLETLSKEEPPKAPEDRIIAPWK